ncbi:MAG: hypothetical protein E6559_08855, partial [Pantoea sp.]|nr:hypothetical protein [Pantoea sp.]
PEVVTVHACRDDVPCRYGTERRARPAVSLQEVLQMARNCNIRLMEENAPEADQGQLFGEF